MHQAKVKEIIYDGFVKLVLVDPSISGSIFDFLLPHFRQFYKEVATYELKLILVETCHFIINLRYRVSVVKFSISYYYYQRVNMSAATPAPCSII